MNTGGQQCLSSWQCRCSTSGAMQMLPSALPGAPPWGQLHRQKHKGPQHAEVTGRKSARVGAQHPLNSQLLPWSAGCGHGLKGFPQHYNTLGDSRADLADQCNTGCLLVACALWQSSLSWTVTVSSQLLRSVHHLPGVYAPPPSTHTHTGISPSSPHWA